MCEDEQGHQEARDQHPRQGRHERGVGLAHEDLSRGHRHGHVEGATTSVCPAPVAALAYHDSPLPIGFDKTISQPFVCPLMTEFLNPQPHESVLEVGTALDYQTAVLAELAGEVWSVEVIKEFAGHARGDGCRGASVPTGKVVQAILDNYAAHQHPRVRAVLSRHPRWVFHFTATTVSWINSIEPYSQP